MCTPIHVISRYETTAIAIGATINGTNRNGLRIIGVPKMIGSLMLNNPGTAETLVIVLSCFDLAKINPAMINPSVAPAPPIHTNHCRNCSGTMYGISPCCPFASHSPFLAIASCQIGLIIDPIIDVP